MNSPTRRLCSFSIPLDERSRTRSFRAARNTLANFPKPSCTRPCHNAAAKRDAAERVSQVWLRLPGKECQKLIERICPRQWPAPERKTVLFEPGGSDTSAIAQRFRSSRTRGVS